MSRQVAPIDTCIARWHEVLAMKRSMDDVLHPDVVFLSPVVFTPQVGRDITKLYLSAAGGTIGGGDSSAKEQAQAAADGTGFRYTKQILSGNEAALEFETTMDGTSVNGVDIITCDDEAMITEFRVMIRPLQAVNVVHEQMKAMLERLG